MGVSNWPDVASLRHENRIEITLLMCEAISGVVLVPVQKLCGTV